MWIVYVWVAISVVGLVAVVASPGDAEPLTPEETAARSEATQTAEYAKQTREAADLHEEQTKEAEKQSTEQTKTAEKLADQQTKEAEDAPVTDAEYCDGLNRSAAAILGTIIVIGEYRQAFINGEASESGIDLVSQLDIIDRASMEIKSLSAPKSAKKVNRKAENLADDLMDKTDDVREEFADAIEYSRGGSLDASTMQIYVNDFLSSLRKLYEVYVDGLKEIYDTKYCEGWRD